MAKAQMFKNLTPEERERLTPYRRAVLRDFKRIYYDRPQKYFPSYLRREWMGKPLLYWQAIMLEFHEGRPETSNHPDSIIKNRRTRMRVIRQIRNEVTPNPWELV